MGKKRNTFIFALKGKAQIKELAVGVCCREDQGFGCKEDQGVDCREDQGVDYRENQGVGCEEDQVVE